MTIDIISIPLGLIGISVGLFRLRHRGRFESMNLTALAFTLGAGLLVRSPWLGDQLLDTAIGELTGWWNVPDLLGHFATFIAAAAALGFFARSLGFSAPLWSTYSCLGLFSLVCLGVYMQSPAKDVQATNMVLLPGMSAYSATFAGALLITHSFGLFIARRGESAAGWRPEIIALTVGTISGIVMAGHRLLVLAFPALRGVAYDLTTWTLTLGCIGGYLTAAAFISVAQRSSRQKTSA